MNRDALREWVSTVVTGFLELQTGVGQLWLWVSRTFFLPGELVLALLAARAPEVIDLLGLNLEEFGVVYAAALSAGIWLLVFMLVKFVYNTIRDVLESTVYSARRIAVAVSHQLRMVRLGLAAPIYRLRRRFRGTKSAYVEEFAIDDLQLGILRAQRRLAPGHVITAIDVANELGVGQVRAQQALDDLKKLHLVEVSFGTTDGFPGYVLTRPGEVLVINPGAGIRRPAR